MRSKAEAEAEVVEEAEGLSAPRRDSWRRVMREAAAGLEEGVDDVTGRTSVAPAGLVSSSIDIDTSIGIGIDGALSSPRRMSALDISIAASILNAHLR
jgi:hypothetical protein